MRDFHNKHRCNPTIVSWETEAARFFVIEFSPTYILRIQIDKEAKKGVS